MFTGPSVWPQLFPQAAGSLQSPVNIETSKSTNDMTLKCQPLYWNYCPEMCTKIINTGYGWKVDATGGEGSGRNFIFCFFISLVLKIPYFHFRKDKNVVIHFVVHTTPLLVLKLFAIHDQTIVGKQFLILTI